MRSQIISSILMGSLIFAPVAFAGTPGQSDQSGQTGQAGQAGQVGQAGQAGQHGGHNGCGFFKKVKCAFKKGYQKGKKVGTKVFDSVQNKVMDTGVAVKKAVTGKKCKTFVKGHYDKNGQHTKGHFRKVCNKPCGKGK